jgi:hypothetical protein
MAEFTALRHVTGRYEQFVCDGRDEPGGCKCIEVAQTILRLERITTVDARLSAWLRASDGGSVLITKGGVSLCWSDAKCGRHEVNVADNALDPLDLGQRATLIERALDEAEKKETPHAHQ